MAAENRRYTISLSPADGAELEEWAKGAALRPAEMAARLVVAAVRGETEAPPATPTAPVRSGADGVVAELRELTEGLREAAAGLVSVLPPVQEQAEAEERQYDRLMFMSRCFHSIAVRAGVPVEDITRIVQGHLRQ